MKTEYLREWELAINQLVVLDPKNNDYKFQMAELAAMQGKIELHQQLLDQLAPTDEPGYCLAHVILAKEAIRRKTYELARRHFATRAPI